MRKVYGWVNERFQIENLFYGVKNKEVPWSKGNILYYFGTASMLFLFIQVVTGLLLFLFYKGSFETAYESVEYISTKVKFGWLIRSVHHWSSELMIISIIIHLLNVFFTQAYRKPRELTWYSGIILLIFTIGFAFSGGLLPWNDSSTVSTVLATDILNSIPIIGGPLWYLFIGETQITGASVGIFYKLHILVLPLMFFLVLVFHVLFIKRQGLSVSGYRAKLEDADTSRIPFYPNFMIRITLLSLIIFNILFSLAVFFPSGTGIKTVEVTVLPQSAEPEWYFQFVFQMINMFNSYVPQVNGKVFGTAIFLLSGLFWFSIPLLDRKSGIEKRSGWITYCSIILLIFIFVFTIIGIIF